ncbi:hypothetical protein FDG2_1415 [Candidatus Protofrankia californiensis]|uniref:Uncharacterized protein n=1 Tax=Candidatus Protofrankia californiensis TaxID=1839754 RepID=A0A1C3NVJ5_9ACTN|nr:hypothetical protein FDG2_1415 [Candidatus Protofrankia californiensis]
MTSLSGRLKPIKRPGVGRLTQDSSGSIRQMIVTEFLYGSSCTALYGFQTSTHDGRLRRDRRPGQADCMDEPGR